MKRNGYKNYSTKRYQVHCMQCQELFIAKRVDAKYCGDLCRKHASLERLKRNRHLREQKTLTPIKAIVKPNPCTEKDLWILQARIAGTILTSEAGSLLGNLHIQRECDKLIQDFERRFGCRLNEVRSIFPHVDPGITLEDNWNCYKTYRNLVYSK